MDDLTTDFTNQKRKRRRNSWIYLLLVIVFFLLAYLSVSYANEILGYIQKIFPGTKLNYSQMENLVSPDKLKGEDSGDINILLLGMRGPGLKDPNLSNAVMIINYDIKDQKINQISLPRDFWVPGKDGSYKKISYVCEKINYHSNPVDCFTAAKYSVEQSTGISPNYTAIIDFDGFTELIDKIGGVNVDVSGHKTEWTFLQESAFVKAQDKKNSNVYHLNGELALRYVRWPENAVPDFDRIYRQQQIMTTVAQRFTSSNFLLNIFDFSTAMQSASNHFYTDLQLWEGKKLAELLKNVNPAKIYKFSLTTDPTDDGGLLQITSFESAETLSPKSGVKNFDQIKSWVSQKIN